MVTPVSAAARTSAIISFGVTGRWGFCALVGTSPVGAKLMISGCSWAVCAWERSSCCVSYCSEFFARAPPGAHGDVLGHHHVEAVAGADLQRRLDLHVAPGGLHAELAHLLAERGGQRLLGVHAVARRVIALALGELDAAGEQRQHQRVAEHLPEVVVDLVVETGVAALVSAGHLAEVERGGVGVDDPGPGDEHPLLARGDAVVVGSDQPGALRDEDEAARSGVVDVLAHLGEELAGQVAVDPADHDGGNDRPGFDFVGRERRLAARGEIMGVASLRRCPVGEKPALGLGLVEVVPLAVPARGLRRASAAIERRRIARPDRLHRASGLALAPAPG